MAPKKYKDPHHLALLKTLRAKSKAEAEQKPPRLKLENVVVRKGSKDHTILGALERVRTHDTTLTEVDMGSGGLGSKGAVALASALLASPRSRCCVCSLSLAGNDIGDSGASSLAHVLRDNASIERLYLSRNGIGVSGAAMLAAALEWPGRVPLPSGAGGGHALPGAGAAGPSRTNEDD